MTAPVVSTPPRLASLVVEALVADPEFRTALLGDLAEESALMHQRAGAAAARRWYWSQVIRSAPSFTRGSLAGGPGPWLRVLLAVVVGYAALASLVIVTDMLIVPALVGGAHPMMTSSILSLALGIPCAVVGGFVAAAVGGRATMVSAFALAALCVGIGLLQLHGAPGSMPLWYQVGLLVIVLPALVAGALLNTEARSRLHRRARRLTRE